jgi:hypothetical protein
VAVPLVDGAQVVDVQVDEGERAAVAARARQLGLGGVVEGAAVRDARQIVGAGVLQRHVEGGEEVGEDDQRADADHRVPVGQATGGGAVDQIDGEPEGGAEERQGRPRVAAGKPGDRDHRQHVQDRQRHIRPGDVAEGGDGHRHRRSPRQQGGAALAAEGLDEGQHEKEAQDVSEFYPRRRSGCR